MELLRPSDVPDARIVRRFRVSRIGALLMFVMVSGLPIVGASFAPELIGALHWTAWILVGPIGAVALAVWLAIWCGTWGMLCGSLRSSNWILALTGDGVYLNLRSPANYRLPAVGPTVAYVPFDAIATAARVTERSRCAGSDEPERVSYWLELRLRHASTDALRDAVRAEARLPAPTRRFLFITSRARCTTRIVFVERPGVVRVAWLGRAALRALQPYVAIDTAGQPREGDSGEDAPLDQRVVTLLERGDRVAAIRLLRAEAGMSLADANELVRGT